MEQRADPRCTFFGDRICRKVGLRGIQSTVTRPPTSSRPGFWNSSWVHPSPIAKGYEAQEQTC